MFCTPEILTDNSPISTMTPTPVNKPNAIESLCIFTNILYMKTITAIHQVGAAK